MEKPNFPGSSRLFGRMNKSDTSTTLFGMPPIPELKKTEADQQSKPVQSTPVFQAKPNPFGSSFGTGFGKAASQTASTSSAPQSSAGFKSSKSPFSSYTGTLSASSNRENIFGKTPDSGQAQRASDTSTKTENPFGKPRESKDLSVRSENPFLKSRESAETSTSKTENPFVKSNEESDSSSAKRKNLFAQPTTSSSSASNAGNPFLKPPESSSQPKSQIFSRVGSNSSENELASSQKSGSNPFVSKAQAKSSLLTTEALKPSSKNIFSNYGKDQTSESANLFKTTASSLKRPESSVTKAQNVFGQISASKSQSASPDSNVNDEKVLDSKRDAKAVFKAPKPVFSGFKKADTPIFSTARKTQQQLATSKMSEEKTEKDKTFLNVNQAELLQILKRQAFTDQDRFEILDARDKLMRARGLNHKSGRVLRGTCPDMCPERERYSRTVKNQLRLYEKMDDSINHRAAVKEYSRSSADQDIPLPHELRPTKVLHLTMNHIMSNIIDRVEDPKMSISDWYNAVESGLSGAQLFTSVSKTEEKDNVGEWFEFVWNTTRAIRKDITQQQLTNLDAVDLVEKCARFHIMCSERLIEEDSNVFSPKLNDENLTKCLQTLKHMYEDLKVEGITCPKEPEFRSYEVLMNLNNGDTLRSILTLERWVRNSSEMKLSLDIFMAINEDNYIRFFKLVRKATLLQGCIVLRYFYQVRKKALETIVRAYCPKVGNVVSYKLTKLCAELGFEDVQSCGEYCQMHGLDFEVNTDVVYLARSQFYVPEELPAPRRAQNLIESKRRGVLWSEVINNGPLRRNPYLDYEPHDSFDKNGYLKPEAFQADDQALEQAPRTPEDIMKQKQYHERQMVKEKCAELIRDELVNTVLELETSKVSGDAIKAVRSDKASVIVAKEIEDAVVNDLLSLTARGALRDAQNQELESRLRKEMQNEACEELAEEVQRKKVDEMIQEVAKKEMVNVERERKMKHIFEAGDVIGQEVIRDFIVAECRKIVSRAVEEALREREHKLEKLRERQKLRLQEEFFQNWRRFTMKKKRAREAMLNFPPCPSDLSLHDQNKKLGELLRRAPFRFDHLRTTNLLFKTVHTADTLHMSVLLKPFDLTTVVGEHLKPRGSHKYWKCILCGPNVCANETNDGKEIFHEASLDLLKLKVTNPHPGSSSDPDLLTSCTIPLQSLSACIRWVDQQILDDEVEANEDQRRRILLGTSGILFIVLDDVESLSSARDRLLQLVQHMYKWPAVPLSILSTCKDVDELTNELKLELLQDSGIFSHISVTTINSNVFFDPTWISKMSSALSWLAASQTEWKPKELKIQPLLEYIEDFLQKVILSEFYAGRKGGQEYVMRQTDPKALIALFNAGVEHLKHSCSKTILKDISWPIPELGHMNEEFAQWNSDSNISYAIDCLNMLLLPNESFSDPNETMWDESSNEVLSYIRQISLPNEKNTVCLDNRVSERLSKAYRSFRRSGRVQIPWTDIIHACIDHRLVQLARKISDEPVVAGYLESDFEKFSYPKAWRSSLVRASQGSRKENLSEKRKRSTCDESVLQSQRICLEDELNASKRFESKLMGATTGRSAEFYNKASEDDEMNVKTRQYLPAISFLSPTLGKTSSSSLTPLISYEVVHQTRTKSLKRNSSLRSLPGTPRMMAKSKRKSYDDPLNLSDKLNEDLEASFRFEQELKRALHSHPAD